MTGFNGAVFVYGHADSGKTHTMQGFYDEKGIAQRAIDQIFKHVAANSSQTTKFRVRVSYVEIFQEKIRDLLGKNPDKNLTLQHSPKTGLPFAEGMSKCRIKSAEDMDKLRRRGDWKRSMHTHELRRKRVRECESEAFLCF